MPMIFLKDFLIFFFIIIFFKLPKIKINRSLKIIYSVLMINIFSVTLYQFFYKGFSEWGQHYVRNVLYIFLTIPTLFSLLKNKLIDLERIIIVFNSLNILSFIYQYLFSKQTMLDQLRPLGLVGDPITLQILTIFSIYYISKRLYENFSIIGYIFLLLSGLIVSTTASVTAFLSAGLAGFCLVIFLLFFRKCDLKVTKKLTPLFISVILTLFIPTRDNNHRLTGRLKVVASGLFGIQFQNTNQQELKHLSQGRIYSIQNTVLFNNHETNIFEDINFYLFGAKLKDYINFDFNPGVLYINWGTIFLILFYGIQIVIIYKSLCLYLHLTNSTVKLKLIMLTCLILTVNILSMGNSIVYRYPLNLFLILFNISLFIINNESSEIAL